MREIAISFGVIVVCGLVLILSLVFNNSGAGEQATSAELTQNQTAVLSGKETPNKEETKLEK